MKKIMLLLSVLLISYSVNCQVKVYGFNLNGANENAPNTSLGTGTATVTVDVGLMTMRVQCDFSGLTGNVTASHIHAATATANTGAAGVATTTPTFPGFPSGVTSGTYDYTLDMSLNTSYNSSYITANGGTAASAFIALVAALDANKAYFNIHSSIYGGGEIRGFTCTLNSNSFELHSKLDVYPNPLKDVLTINNKTNKSLKVEILDLAGKLIDSKTVNFNTSQFDYSYLKSGIYLIKINTADKQSTTFKIIKS
ncbi:CHRD domain-containing protein [Flavobacterium cellulosilyticum]|uniref:T9SS type A sorting domain-containing protein n=1 Tax=Flavobacterium cellulosilyticum TaxID=2541731 RepID=A0A4V2YYY6_9FLAO|nr:CHRD domain-containing protein [Flavobacterium cellulosilyticum]TDD94947.1 T9SS type A sorting domain-containing protein [Flavobacterium cellulosilyticum]